MFSEPTRSVPGGLLFVFFGLLTLVFAGLAGYAGSLVPGTEYFTDTEKPRVLWTLLFMSGAGLLTGVGLTAVGMRLALKTAPYNQDDPKEPMLKW